MEQFKRAYYDAFSCIASACPDSCCQEWDVAVDEASAHFYRNLEGPLGDRLREVLYQEDGVAYMAIQDRRCPMWRQDGLCRIQAELGEGALCQTCREFPRLRHDYGDFVELQLELSCPEAARLILSAPWEALQMQQLPGEEAAGYEEDAMFLLRSSRSRALELVSREQLPMGQRLALLLLYACRLQGELDGEEPQPFDEAAALETAGTMAQPWDAGEMLRFFLELEILTPQWEERLRSPAPGPWAEQTPALARYLIERYWLQAVSDYDLYCRAKLIVLACLLLRELGGDFLRTAQLFSKEIENSADNVDSLLDGAYRSRCFTDDKLLGALMKE